MKGARSIALGAAAGLAAAASAQTIITPGVTASLDLTWQEDPAFPHNDNGVLEPGEHALIRMTLSFTGQNTVAIFEPGEVFTSGTILGLGSCYVDIRGLAGDASGLYNGGITSPTSTSLGPNADNAGATGYGVRGGWRLGGNIANGEPAANGMVNIGPGQLPTDPTVANRTNPIANIERLGWQPSSYAQRTQTFTVAGAVGTNNNIVGLYLQFDDGATVGGAAYLLTSRITFGSGNIPIAPAPAGLALLGLGGLIVGTRYRRTTARACKEATT
jgi:hypothetical protein